MSSLIDINLTLIYILAATLTDYNVIGDPKPCTFAHEFAHLAFWHLSAEEQAYFEALYASARNVPWAWTAYQTSNIDEFFAVSYEDWLAEVWGVSARRPDSSGWWQEVCDAFADLAR